VAAGPDPFDVVVGAVVGVVDATGVLDGVVVGEGRGRAPLPAAGPLRQDTPVRYPRPVGMVSMVQVRPSFVVTTTTPAT
jgi:hypothetical protein